MIRFSKMADYGVLLLGHFAQHEDGQSSASELASRYHMPRSVVANLLKAYGKAGLLESRRGPAGGYRLARSAEDITLLEILSVIEGPVGLIQCAVEAAGEHCEYIDVCPSKSPMQAVNRRLVDMLREMSLAELMGTSSHAHAGRVHSSPATPHD